MNKSKQTSISSQNDKPRCITSKYISKIVS